MRNMARMGNSCNINGATNHAENIVGIFEDGYYNINKRMLYYVGLWPYQSVFERGIRVSFISLVGFSLMVPQILKLVQSWSEVGIFIECFSPTIANILMHIKLLYCVFHIQKIKRLLDEVRNDWECTRYMPEQKILHEHGRTGRRYTIAYLIMVYTAVASWTAVPLVPIIMDIVAPLNESRPHVKFFQTDYRVDANKYFYPIFIHGSSVTAIGILVYVAVDTFFMTLAQHACAIMNILRYRLENMVQEDDKVSIRHNTNDREQFYYQEVVACIKQHKRYIEYIWIIQATCEWYLVIAIGLNMLVISCTGSQIIAKGTSTGDVLRFAFFAVAQIVHLFCNSLPGHWIMDTSSLLPDSAYDCHWYLMSPRTRKLIVLLILRSMEPCTIIAGKMYVVSMENFRCVLQTSMSYLTLLTSMQ